MADHNARNVMALHVPVQPLRSMQPDQPVLHHTEHLNLFYVCNQLSMVRYPTFGWS
jgi:hypothetical protein